LETVESLEPQPATATAATTAANHHCTLTLGHRTRLSMPSRPQHWGGSCDYP
jgi:hypothetical protein